MRVGFFGLLGLLFIGLKLGGVINWPWVWVVSPLWIPMVGCLVLAFGLALIGVVSIIFKTIKRRN